MPVPNPNGLKVVNQHYKTVRYPKNVRDVQEVAVADNCGKGIFLTSVSKINIFML